MAKTDHNKILGIIHLAYGAFSVVVMILVTIFMLGVFGLIAADQGAGAAPMGIVALIMIFVVLFNLLFTAPSFLAGYAMLRRRRWAKGAGIVAAIVDGMSFPFGTALCVYTLWFIFSEDGRRLYDKNLYALPPPPPRWVTAPARQREIEYVPPAAPPDWR